MTQEEKAKRYDEALEELRGLLEGIREEKCKILEEDITSIFPELQENEDERIRKELIFYLGDMPEDTELRNGVTNRDVLVWLEKQGEQKSQGKSALEAINEEKVDNANKVEPKDYSSIDPHFGKPVDKVESKFKIGDWVFSSVLGTARIIGVNDSNEYQLEYIDGKQEFSSIDYVNYAYDKWTLKDAKNGDVLYSPKGAGVEGIFLIKGWKQVECTGKTLCSSIGYRVEEDEIVVSEPGAIGAIGAIWWKGVVDLFYPATKEQRDLLFQKMKEEGYVWDVEKNQLRKMEHDKSKFQILKTAWYVCTCTTCTEDSRIWFNNGTAYLGSEILKSDLGFEPEEYQNYFRLWTIQDAKPGDILASKDGKSILIFRHFSLDDDDTFASYYSITFSPYYYMQGYDEYNWLNTNFVPATKKQRDLLFQKMQEADYEWDSEKKQLRKIESNFYLE